MTTSHDSERCLPRPGHSRGTETGFVEGERKLVRVPDGAPSAIIVEVRKDIVTWSPHVGQPGCPTAQRLPAVARMWTCPAFMESDITPVGGAPQRRTLPRIIAQAEGRFELVQELEELVTMPGLVPRLDSNPGLRWKRFEGCAQRVEVDPQTWRQLQQDRSQLRAQAARSLHEPPDSCSSAP